MTRSIERLNVGIFEVATDLPTVHDTESARRLRELESAVAIAVAEHGFVTVPPPAPESSHHYNLGGGSAGVLTRPENCTETSEGMVIHNDDLGVCATCGKRLHVGGMDQLIDRRSRSEFNSEKNRISGNMVCKSEACMREAREKKAIDGYYWVAVDGGHDQVFKIGDGLESGVEGTEDNLASYRSLNRNIYKQSIHHRFAFGVEIEKECEETWEACDILAESLRHNWVAVSDGSLDECGGFELVSPAYSFTDESLEPFSRTEFENAIDALPVDADTTRNCGGHINISCYGLNGPSLAKKIAPLFPFLYALYPSRVYGDSSEYSYACDYRDSTEEGRKFRAINTLSNRVELRLFPAVENKGQLKGRLNVIHEALRLIESDSDGQNYILSNDESNYRIGSALADPDSPLSKSILELANDTSGSSRDIARRARYEKFSCWFNHRENGESMDLCDYGIFDD